MTYNAVTNASQLRTGVASHSFVGGWSGIPLRAEEKPSLSMHTSSLDVTIIYDNLSYSTPPLLLLPNVKNRETRKLSWCSSARNFRSPLVPRGVCVPSLAFRTDSKKSLRRPHENDQNLSTFTTQPHRYLRTQVLFPKGGRDLSCCTRRLLRGSS